MNKYMKYISEDYSLNREFDREDYSLSEDYKHSQIHYTLFDAKSKFEIENELYSYTRFSSMISAGHHYVYQITRSHFSMCDYEDWEEAIP